jgi:prepilin-type processing-associated H-X9-DG protein
MIGNTKVLWCPADKERTAATQWPAVRTANISYFVISNAVNDSRESLLLGDRNLTLNGELLKNGIWTPTNTYIVGWSKDMHRNAGNIAMADGSIMRISGKELNIIKECS